MNKELLNIEYIVKAIIINIIEMIVIGNLFGFTIDNCMGYKCLYSDALNFKLLNIVPFSLLTVILLNTIENEADVSTFYALPRYCNIKRFAKNITLKFLYNHFVIYFSSFLLSCAFIKYENITQYFIMAFYIINNSMMWTSLALIYFTLLNKTKNKSIISFAIIIAIIIFLMLWEHIYNFNHIFLFVSLFSTGHICVLNSVVEYNMSIISNAVIIISVFKIFVFTSKKQNF